MVNENKYLQALSEISNDNFDEKKWLIKNFELYKQTLNWPENRPAINLSGLIKGTLSEKFNSTYYENLLEFEHELNNKEKKLIFKNN